GNGWALLLVPPLAVLLSRRLYLLARPSFWYPFVIVLVLCGPWQLLTLRMVKDGWEYQAGLEFTRKAILYYSWSLVKVTGVGLSLLIALGLIARVVQPFREKQLGGRWAAAAALLL